MLSKKEIEEIKLKVKNVEGLEGMTINERLYVAGIMDIYDGCNFFDRRKIYKIITNQNKE